MKFTLGIITFILLLVVNANSHSGGTNAGGCHMNYTTGQYHCHKAKQTDPFKTYYYIKHQGRSYGPYSSYSSCMSAIRGSGVIGAYCSTSKY
tara:strand:+ start:111 stop:386 length:276 start_codon:yes stop_codon:yes gene_type:complete